MDKFSSKIDKIEERKFVDKTKNEIYEIIKENISVNISRNNATIRGMEDLTNNIFDYIQKERAKQEILTLERMKLNVSVGIFNIQEINEHIDNLKNMIKS